MATEEWEFDESSYPVLPDANWGIGKKKKKRKGPNIFTEQELLKAVRLPRLTGAKRKEREQPAADTDDPAAANGLQRSDRHADGGNEEGGGKPLKEGKGGSRQRKKQRDATMPYGSAPGEQETGVDAAATAAHDAAQVEVEAYVTGGKKQEKKKKKNTQHSADDSMMEVEEAGGVGPQSERGNGVQVRQTSDQQQEQQPLKKKKKKEKHNQEPVQQLEADAVHDAEQSRVKKKTKQHEHDQIQQADDNRAHDAEQSHSKTKKQRNAESAEQVGTDAIAQADQPLSKKKKKHKEEEPAEQAGTVTMDDVEQSRGKKKTKKENQEPAGDADVDAVHNAAQSPRKKKKTTKVQTEDKPGANGSDSQQVQTVNTASDVKISPQAADQDIQDNKQKRKNKELKTSTNNKHDTVSNVATKGNDQHTGKKHPKPASAQDGDAVETNQQNTPSLPFTSLLLPKGASGSSLLAKMREQLQGGRFRQLNEMLYTQPSDEAVRRVQEEPELFEQYHKGFEAQIKGWPKKPVEQAIAWLSKHPKTWRVADFGCGDGRLGRTVQQDVTSLDLVAASPEIIACNMAATPLQTGSMDAVVFCLSLMGTDYGSFLEEAARVTKSSGWIWVAEVKSRFAQHGDKEDLAPFIAAMRKLGFSLVKQDSNNTMFVAMLFRKRGNPPPRGNIQWPALKACVYKKR